MYKYYEAIFISVLGCLGAFSIYYSSTENNSDVAEVTYSAKENEVTTNPYELGLFMHKENATESDIENLLFNGLKHYDLAVVVKMNDGTIMNLGYPFVDGELSGAIKFNMERTNGYLTDITAYTELNLNPQHRLNRELISHARSEKMDKIGEYKLFNTALIVNSNSNSQQTVVVYFEEKPKQEPTEQHTLATIIKSQYDTWMENRKDL